jgi:hypothetical protein
MSKTGCSQRENRAFYVTANLREGKFINSLLVVSSNERDKIQRYKVFGSLFRGQGGI